MSLNPRDIVVVDGVRTAMAKAKNGAFRHVRAENLSAAVMQSLFTRNAGLDPSEVDDVIWGCVNQTLEQSMNIARNARSEEHTSELQSRPHLVCRLLLE